MNLNNLLKKSLHKVDEEILIRLDATVPLLSKIGSHLIKVKGKRIRPSLTLAMSAQLDDFSRNPILLATAVEFIHTATLLHDDVVDQSNLRRGIKSANIIWGNEASVLAGDFLFAQSFDLMVETKSLKSIKQFKMKKKETTRQRQKRRAMELKAAKEAKQVRPEMIIVPEDNLTVQELADKLSLESSEIIKSLFFKGITATVT